MSITYGPKRERKERISLSIDPVLLASLDRTVDNIAVFSRSQAVEDILRKHIAERRKCVILAGGPEKNLRVGKTYRPLIEVHGKPLIKHIIEKSKAAGFEDIIIVGSKEVLSHIFRALGEAGIEYIEERTHLNTAKTLQLARDRIRSTFLFVPCDHYFEVDLKEMYRYHCHNRPACTLAVYSGIVDEWKKSSIVQMEGNRIVDYAESPNRTKSHLTSLMIGIAEPEMLGSIPQAELSYSLQKDVFPALAKEGKLLGYLYAGRWRNIHSEDDAHQI